MDSSTFKMLQIFFAFSFTLHNAEEAVWLPAWSQHAARYHQPVGKTEFIFAVVIITILGYLLTALDWLWGSTIPLFQYIFLGYAGMMGLNSIFPHGLATVVLRRYAPGFLTGVLLNLPLSVLLIYFALQNGCSALLISAGILVCSVGVLASLPVLFQLGKRWLVH